MGDFRNKARKEEARLRQEAWLRKHCPPTPTLPPARCFGCEKTYHEVETLHAIQPEDRWRDTEYWCNNCLPISGHGHWFIVR